MSREEVFEGLKELIAGMRPQTDLSKVTYNTELVRELGIDSLFMILLSYGNTSTAFLSNFLMIGSYF